MPAPSPAERLRARRNVVLFVTFAAIAVFVGLVPTVCTYVLQPQGYWPRYAQAPRAGPDALPPLVPPSATEIHTRHDNSEHMRWVRFTFAARDHGRVTAGLRRLPLNEARALPITGPGFTPWWTVNERTMLGKAGDRLEVYQLPGRTAWLVVDPASSSGFYWSRER